MEKATRERRFRARAARIDSAVVEADIPYPTDAGLARAGVRALAREGGKLRTLAGTGSRVRDRSRAIGRRLRTLGRTARRRSGEAKAEVLRLTGESGRLLSASVSEARTLAREARRRARGPGAGGKLAAARKLEQLAERCERISERIEMRLRGERVTERLVSLSDPDARPISKGKLGKPTAFGYVCQLAELTPSTRPGARGFILPPASAEGDPGENELFPKTVAELTALGLRPREVALDGGFQTQASEEALAPLGCKRIFIAGRNQAGLTAHAEAARPLPNGRRRPGLGPETALWPQAKPPQGHRGPAHLDGLGGLCLQPRYLRNPRLATEPATDVAAREPSSIEGHQVSSSPDGDVNSAFFRGK